MKKILLLLISLLFCINIVYSYNLNSSNYSLSVFVTLGNDFINMGNGTIRCNDSGGAWGWLLNASLNFTGWDISTCANQRIALGGNASINISRYPI